MWLLPRVLPLACAVIAAGKVVHAAQVDVLILAGQSNMVGQANVTATLPGADPVDPQISYSYDVTNVAGTFADSSTGFEGLGPWRFDASTERFGPEMSLGRDLNAAGLTPALIKYAVGGSDIARWQPGQPDFVGLRSRVLSGVGGLLRRGDSVNLLGVVWLQGESDVISTARADSYAANLDGFLGGFRSQLDADLPGLGFGEMDVVLVEPADWKNGSNPGIATAADIAKVDQALVDFAEADANAGFVPTDDFTVFGDGLIHFGAADQVTLGSRIADAVIVLRVPEPSSLAIFLCAGTAALRRAPRREPIGS